MSGEEFEFKPELQDLTEEALEKALVAIGEFKKAELIKLRKKQMEELFCPRCGMTAAHTYWHNDSPTGVCMDCNVYIAGIEDDAPSLAVKFIPRSNVKDIGNGDFIPYEGQYFYDTDANECKKYVAGEIVGCEEELMEPMGKVCLPCWGDK